MKALYLFVLLGVALTGCTQSEICADFGPNSTVTDVRYDSEENALTVSYFIHNSYCTGTDEPRYTIRLLTVDLDAMTEDTKEKETQKLDLYPIRDGGEHLFEESRFTAGTCNRCELRLNTRDGRYSFDFITGPPYDGEEVMALEIFEGDALRYETDLSY